MRKLIFTLAACALAATAATAQETAAPAPDVTAPVKAAPAPDPRPATPAVPPRHVPLKAVPEEILERELKDIDGQSFRLSGYRGRVFVVNLWATWCGPCRREIPELNKLYEEFGGRGVEFVGLTTENPLEDAEKVRRFADEYGMRYKLGWADREVAVALMSGRSSIPQTLVVAGDGGVVAHFRGYSPRLAELIRSAVEKALDPAPAAETLEPPRP